MQTCGNNLSNDSSISTVIKNALLSFKDVSRQLKKNQVFGGKLSNLSLYALLCLHNSKPLLRNDLMKRLKINYYDAGAALDQLILNNLVLLESVKELSTLKSGVVNRKRFRLTLMGEMFVDEFLNNLV